MNIGIRKELHPTVDGDKVEIPIAYYILNSDTMATLYKMFEELISLDGYLSNISRSVKDNGKKISCLKSHDHHVFIQQLLPFAVRGLLLKNVYEPLIKLSMFFQNL